MEFVQYFYAVRGLFSFFRFGISKFGQASFYLEQQSAPNSASKLGLSCCDTIGISATTTQKISTLESSEKRKSELRASRPQGLTRSRPCQGGSLPLYLRVCAEVPRYLPINLVTRAKWPPVWTAHSLTACGTTTVA